MRQALWAPPPPSPPRLFDYHDDIGQVCRAQGVDSARAPHHRGPHVSNGDSQGACVKQGEGCEDEAFQ